jgi:hypothetical protein
MNATVVGPPPGRRFHRSTASRPPAPGRIYDSAGNLLATGSDDPSQGGPDSEFFSIVVPEDGVYYVAVGGGLPTDPFDETTGTNTDITSLYEAMYIVDADESFVGVGLADWTANGRRKTAQTRPTQFGKKGPLARFTELLDQRKSDANTEAEAAAAENTEEEPLDVDYYLVDLRKGDAIASGFDASRQVGILDPDRVQRSGASFNPSFIYPLESPLSTFLERWDLDPSDEDAVIDATIDAAIETLDHDLRVLDGRNGDRDATNRGTEFDVLVLNSRARAVDR